jgi:uroporphyrinogen decarboxylase
MMSEMTAIERVDMHIDLQEPDRVGIAPMGEFYYAGLADMTIEDVLMDPWKADEAFEYGFEKHGGFDMAEVGFLLAMYLSPVPDAFSTFYLDWHLPGRERAPEAIPNLNERAKENPLMTEDDYETVIKHGFHRFFSFERAGVGDLALLGMQTPKTAEIVQKWWGEYQVPTMIDASIGEPTGVLSELRGSTNFLLDLYRRPDEVLEVLDVLSDGLIASGLALADMVHAKTLILGSGRASADFMSPEMFEKFCLPFLIRAANAAVEAGYRLQYHFDTNWTPMLEYLKELPPKSGYLHLDERTDIFKAKEILGDHLCLFGNLKPSLFVLGTEEEVEREVKSIIDGCADGGGLIISAELTADSRFELVDKMVQVTKEYGVY